MGAGAAANPTPQGPPPGVTLAPPMPGPPPGVTLAPPTPQPAAPVAAPSAPAAPAAPTTPASAWQNLKQAVLGNIDRNLNAPSADVPGLSELNDMGRGIAKGAAQTIGGLSKLGARVAGAVTGSQPQELLDTAKWFNDHSQTQGFWEGLGSGTEGFAELLGGDGLVKLAPELGIEGKAAGIADRLKQSEKVATFLKNNPKMEKLITLGMRTAHAAAIAGGQAGVQTYVKSGGDLDQTKEAAELGAAGGAVLHGATEAVGGVVRHLRPNVATIAGEEVPILRSQETTTAPDGTPIRPSTLQEIAATTKDSPEVAGQQQAAAARTVQQEAQGVLERELGAANETRTGSPDPGATPPAEPGAPAAGPGVDAAAAADGGLPAGAPAPSQATGTPIAGRLTDGEAGLVPRPAYSVEDQSLPGLGAGGGLADAAGSAEDAASAAPVQPGAAGLPSPGNYKLQPIDIKSVLASTHDFGDAADHLHAAGKAVYDRLNEVSGGQWQAADQRIQALQSKYLKTVGPERNQIGQELSTANRQMEKLFNDPKTGVSPEDLSSAKRLWRSGYMLRDLHNALEPAYQVDADFSRKTLTYRGFNGGLALSRLRSQMRNNPELKELLGPQSADNLQRIFQYNVTGAGRARFGGALTGVAKWVADHAGSVIGTAGTGIGYAVGGKEGALTAGAGSEAAYQALKYVLHRVATDPKVGQNLLYAIEGGARPENYSPLIGRMILEGTKRYGIPLAAGGIARQ